MITDLTHLIHPGIPVYPGTPEPLLDPLATLEREGYRETLLTAGSHTGTHMDAPAHMIPGGKTLDRFQVSHFTGKGVVITIPRGTAAIEKSFCKKSETAISKADYLLLRTGWCRFWGEEGYFSGFPVLTEEAALWLTGFSLKGIGIDAISMDAPESETWPVHRILLGAGMVVVENLCFPMEFTATDFLFTALPLNFQDADGAPVRAIALSAVGQL